MEGDAEGKTQDQTTPSRQCQQDTFSNFCKHHRTIIKTENPTLTFGEVAKALGALWKSQDADEKKKYTDPAYISSSTTPNTNKVDATDDTKKAKRARKNKD